MHPHIVQLQISQKQINENSTCSHFPDLPFGAFSFPCLCTTKQDIYKISTHMAMVI